MPRAAPRNPNWTRDELILALDLYFSIGAARITATDPDVIELSKLLKSLPVHNPEIITEQFRSPSSVSMKLSNFLRLDPDYSGVGLKRGSQLDKVIWEEFASDRELLAKTAKAIRLNYRASFVTPSHVYLEEESEEEFLEGQILTRLHKVRERNRRIVEKKKLAVLRRTGALSCEVCGFDSAEFYGDIGIDIAECHHLVPLSKSDHQKKTQLTDLAIVCANCHRIVHSTRPMPTVAALRDLVLSRSQSIDASARECSKAIVDFAIITALTEEFEVLRAIFPPFQEYSENANIWYRTRVKSKMGENYEIVAAFQNEMGPLDAHDLTAKVIERWDPAYIILVGIAGSFHKDLKLGDVIVSQQIFYYDPGKATHEGIQYRPQGYPCSTVLIRQTEALRVDKAVVSDWQQAAKESASKKAERFEGKNKKKTKKARKFLSAHRPEIHFGTVASGSHVIAAKKKQKELLALHGKIIGTEMEGAGVLHATFRQELPTPAILIKGLSDAADKNKARLDAEVFWRELAKENPVRLVLELIQRGRIRPLLTDQFYLDPTRGTLEDARKMIPEVASLGDSYLAFPRLVVPKGPLTEVQINIDAVGRDGSLEIGTLIVSYLDREGNRKYKSVKRSRPIVVLPKPILAAPLGIYMLIHGTADHIAFKVASPNSEKSLDWFP